jgi:hypothetical protein
MSNPLDADPLTDATRLLKLLSDTGTYLVPVRGQWVLRPAEKRREEYEQAVTADGIALLCRQGHLVSRPGGGLEPRSAHQPRDARASSRRPVTPPADGSERPAFNDVESPLAWLRARRDKAGRPLLAREQVLAGEKLRADYERACMGRRVTASWDLAAAAGQSTGQSHDPSDAALAARQRFHRAVDAVGPELSSILLQVCCLAAGIEQAERILDLPQRSGRAVLALALTALARHYGYLRTGVSKEIKGRYWAIVGYRPAIPADGEA